MFFKCNFFTKDFIVAIIVPEEEYLLAYCKKNNINGTFKELCRNEVIFLLFLNYQDLL